MKEVIFFGLLLKFSSSLLGSIFGVFSLTKGSCQKSKQSVLDMLLSKRSLIVLLTLSKGKEIIAEDKEDLREEYLNEKK